MYFYSMENYNTSKFTKALYSKAIQYLNRKIEQTSMYIRQIGRCLNIYNRNLTKSDSKCLRNNK